MRSGGAGVALCHCCQLPASKLGFTRTAANDSGWHLADGMCNGTVTPLRVLKMKYGRLRSIHFLISRVCFLPWALCTQYARVVRCLVYTY